VALSKYLAGRSASSPGPDAGHAAAGGAIVAAPDTTRERGSRAVVAGNIRRFPPPWTNNPNPNPNLLPSIKEVASTTIKAAST